MDSGLKTSHVVKSQPIFFNLQLNRFIFIFIYGRTYLERTSEIIAIFESKVKSPKTYKIFIICAKRFKSD